MTSSSPTGHRPGVLFVLAAAVLFGTTGTALEWFAPADASALSVGAVRLLIGGPLLAFVALRLGATLTLWRRFFASTVFAAGGVVAFQLLYFVATTRTGVALGTVVTIGSGPMFSGLIDGVRTGRLPSPRWCFGTALSVAGVCLLGLTGDRDAVDLWGLAAAACAGLGWATFATISRWQIERGHHSTASLAGMFTLAALVCSPLLLTEPLGWLATPRGVSVAVYLGAITLTLAYLLYGWGLASLAAPTVITLTLAEPVTAAVLAAAVVGEEVAPLGWVGIALVLIGLVTTARAATVPTDEPRQHPGNPPAHAAQRT